jgi:hypothetical protein
MTTNFAARMPVSHKKFSCRARYGPTNAAARLDWTPMVDFWGGAVTMYGAIRREARARRRRSRSSAGCATARRGDRRPRLR